MIGKFGNDIELTSHKSFGTVLEISKQLISNMCHINYKMVVISSIEILYEANRFGILTFMSSHNSNNTESITNLYSNLKIMEII